MNLNEVKIKKLVIHKDERGYLFEGLRKDDSMFNGEYGQCLISVVYAGIIKGFHKHEKQTDYTLCAKGKVLYIVSDGKEIKKIILDGEDPLLVKVPPGLWHGYKALEKEAILIHIMDTIYDLEDTEAKDPHSFGDVWKIKNPNSKPQKSLDVAKEQ